MVPGALLLCSSLLVLAGAAPSSVIYLFIETCAVEGSTATLPCTFTPLKSFSIVRVRWCQNHQICQGSTPSVYNSDSPVHDPRYRYLGDLESNCTLQITDIQMGDNAVLRFRMEANDRRGHFTDQTGVKVTVVEETPLTIKGSDQTEVIQGQTVSLQCTSATCTFHQLEVTWFRDDHALPESGHTLQLGPLTAEDSGNYSCALKTNVKLRSKPFSLQVEEHGGAAPETIIRLVSFGVITLITITAASTAVKRTCSVGRQQVSSEN